jgi:4-hydroxybenzoate polyprenyltransferase
MNMIKKKLILLLLYCEYIYAFNFNTLQMKTHNKIMNDFSPITTNKLKHYYKLTRPSSLVYEFALPVTGSYLATKNIGVLFDPNVILIGLLSVLIGSNSMIINDFYDYIDGTDSSKIDKILNRNLLKPMEVLHFSLYMSILTFSLINFINNFNIRLILSNSIILSYLYTPFFKKITFLKNLIVSYIICNTIIIGSLIVNGNIYNILPCIIYLFNFIMWQEIILDINDLEGDKENNIKTIAVKYGYDKANKIAFSFLLIGTLLPYGFSLNFILLQLPLVLLHFRAIQKEKILNKIVVHLSKFIMLVSGLYMCILI